MPESSPRPEEADGTLRVKLEHPVRVQQVEASVPDPYVVYLEAADRSKVRVLCETYRETLRYVLAVALEHLFDGGDLQVDRVEGDSAAASLYRVRSWRGPQKATFLWSATYWLRDPQGRRAVLRAELSDEEFSEPSVAVYVREGDEAAGEAVFERIRNLLGAGRRERFDGTGQPLMLEDHPAWEDAILAAETRAVLSANTVGIFEKADLFRRHGVPMKRGILLYGPPGNGKTLVGKILAHALPGAFIWVTPGRLPFAFRRRIANLEGVYTLARTVRPALVFIEDLDLLGGEDRSEIASGEFLGELLNQLDGFESNQDVVTVATTTNLEGIDEALAGRPGRFDLLVELPNPSPEHRAQMIRRQLPPAVWGEGVELDGLVARTEGFSFAHVKEAVIRSKILAVERARTDAAGQLLLGRDLVDEALDSMRRQGARIGFHAE